MGLRDCFLASGVPSKQNVRIYPAMSTCSACAMQTLHLWLSDFWAICGRLAQPAFPGACRCEEGYVPPEAHQGSPFTTAADVYQFGGLCYFMATGTHPPAGLHQAFLPDCIAEEWRQLVSLCRAGNPADRPIVAQLQLYLHSTCHQPVKQALKAMRSSGKASPAVSAQRYSSGQRQGLPSPAMSHRGLQALEVADSAAALPRMASNPLFAPGKHSIRSDSC